MWKRLKAPSESLKILYLKFALQLSRQEYFAEFAVYWTQAISLHKREQPLKSECYKRANCLIFIISKIETWWFLIRAQRGKK